MAVTPLYVKLLKDGERLYIFPGAGEDLSTAAYNENNKIFFTKAVFLNIPSERLEEGVGDTDEKFYIPDSKFEYFSQSYADRLIDGLRSYVANAEQVIRENLDSDGKYTYDPRLTRNLSERLFWKWLNRNNILQLESAIPYEDYNADLADLQNPTGNTSVDYHPQRLWRERKVEPLPLLDVGGVELVQDLGSETVIVPCDDCPGSGSGSGSGPSVAEVLVPAEHLIRIRTIDETNLRNGDWILISGVANLIVPNYFKIIQKINKSEFIVSVPREATIAIGAEVLTAASWTEKIPGIQREVMLKYSRVIVNISDIQSVNPVQVGSRSWTEITSYLPATVGRTPIALFKTIADKNYGPSKVFPEASDRQQEEILGAESPQSPINVNPENFPGTKWGIFDKDLADTIGDGTSGGYIYLTPNGDSARLYGDYFGVYALRNTDTDLDLFDSSRIDGLVLDFDLAHYTDAKASDDNLNKVINTWQDFSSANFRGNKPLNFEFNAIAWFYDTTYNDGVTSERSSNLFGITILGHPDDNPKTSEVGIRIPTIKKIVADGERTGSSHVFTLNNYLNLADPIPVIVRDDITVNNSFGFELYTKAMNELAQVNDLFKIAQSEFTKIASIVDQLASTQWTQPQLDSVNNRVSSLENLLRLYSTLQLRDSDSIRQQTVNIDNRVYTQLLNVTPTYAQLYTVLSNTVDNIRQYLLPEGRSMLLRYINQNTTNTFVDRISLIGNFRVGQSIRVEILSSNISRKNSGMSLSLQVGSQRILIYNSIYLPIQSIASGRGYLQKYGTLLERNVYNITNPTGSPLVRTISIDTAITTNLANGDQILIKNVIRAGQVLDRSMIVYSSTNGSIVVYEPEGVNSIPMTISASTTFSIPSKLILDITRLTTNNNSNDFLTNISYY